MTGYNLSDYRYDLPEELIAQHPAPRREESRLMVVHLDDDRVEHRRFRNIAGYLDPGDLVVVNDTRVIPARLLGRRRSGGAVEVLLLQRIAPAHGEPADRWIALARPSARLKEGETVFVDGGAEAVLVRSLGGGRWEVAFAEEDLARVGRAPLPPYIKRSADDTSLVEEDRERYQTVYARQDGAAAAPTAGLHFSEALIEGLKAQGVGFESVTLHVGLGTFRPIQAEDIRDHTMHTERFALSGEAARAVNATRTRGNRIVACGTTTMRVLESVADEEGRLPESGEEGETGIFIYPPHRFRVTRSMITNFHLPGSSLMVMLAALVGRERLLALYEVAVAERYRFYSYGDAMLVLG